MSERPTNFERSWRIMEYLRKNSDQEHYAQIIPSPELFCKPFLSLDGFHREFILISDFCNSVDKETLPHLQKSLAPLY